MKTLLLFLGLVSSITLLTARTSVETVVVSAEEILANKAPVTCEVQQRKDGSVSLKLSVASLSGAKGYFEGFDLRVLKKPSPPSEIKEKVLREELLEWHRPNLEKVTLFVVTEEEIPKSYVVARWSSGADSSGMLQMKAVCFEVRALVEAATKRRDDAPALTAPSGRGSL